MAFLFILCLVAPAEEKVKIKAEKMEIILIANERVSHFDEGLTISAKDAEIQSQEGYYFPNQNRFILRGEVVIKSEDGELRGDSCIYDLESGESELYKNVEIRLETLSIFTNHLRLNSRERTAHSREILLIPKEKNWELKAWDGIYNLSQKSGRAREVSILIKGEETTKVKAEEIFYTQPTAQLRLASAVEVEQREGKVFCDTLVYFISGDSGICTGNPNFKGEREEIRGRIFTFWTDKGDLKAIRAREDVSVFYETDKERIEIKGEEFSLVMTNGEIEELSVAEITSGRLVRKGGK